ncbi:hypothetical protein ACQP1U_17780 [Actinomycetota bacterium]
MTTTILTAAAVLIGMLLMALMAIVPLLLNREARQEAMGATVHDLAAHRASRTHSAHAA